MISVSAARIGQLAIRTEWTNLNRHEQFVAARKQGLTTEIAKVNAVLTFPYTVQRMLLRIPLLNHGLIEQPGATDIGRNTVSKIVGVLRRRRFFDLRIETGNIQSVVHIHDPSATRVEHVGR